MLSGAIPKLADHGNCNLAAVTAYHDYQKYFSGINCILLIMSEKLFCEV